MKTKLQEYKEWRGREDKKVGIGLLIFFGSYFLIGIYLGKNPPFSWLHLVWVIIAIILGYYYIRQHNKNPLKELEDKQTKAINWFNELDILEEIRIWEKETSQEDSKNKQ